MSPTSRLAEPLAIYVRPVSIKPLLVYVMGVPRSDIVPVST